MSKRGPKLKYSEYESALIEVSKDLPFYGGNYAEAYSMVLHGANAVDIVAKTEVYLPSLIYYLKDEGAARIIGPLVSDAQLVEDFFNGSLHQRRTERNQAVSAQALEKKKIEAARQKTEKERQKQTKDKNDSDERRRNKWRQVLVASHSPIGLELEHSLSDMLIEKTIEALIAHDKMYFLELSKTTSKLLIALSDLLWMKGSRSKTDYVISDLDVSVKVWGPLSYPIPNDIYFVLIGKGSDDRRWFAITNGPESSASQKFCACIMSCIDRAD